MPTTMQIQIQRALSLAAAVGGALIALHALLTVVMVPAGVQVWRGKALSGASALARLEQGLPGPWYPALTGLFCLLLLLAAALSVVLARSAHKTPHARHLMAALGFGACAIGWFTFARAWMPSRAADMVAMAAVAYASVLFARFFIWFPRPLTEQELAEVMYRQRPTKPGVLGKLEAWTMSMGWILPEKWRARSRSRAEREYRLLTWKGTEYVVAAIAAACVLLVPLMPALKPVLRDAHWLVQTVVIALVGTALLPPALMPITALAFAGYAAKAQRDLGGEDERRRMQWLFWPQFAVQGLFMVALIVLAAWLGLRSWQGAELPPARLVLHLGVLFSLTAWVLAVLAGLGVAVLYQGAIDPQLAVTRLSAWSLLALGLTLLFLVTERVLARQVVDFFGWHADSGGAVAGAVVAFTFGPLRKRTDVLVRDIVQRWAPLRTLEGERVVRTVCFTDLSGYSAVAVKEEGRALLLAALLQRQARSHAERNGGRLVKSLGDGVILEFPDAASGIHAVQALYRAFPAAAAEIATDPLPLHSGLHTGEVLLAPDGDLFGANVNLAARLQDAAAAGEVLVSADVAREAAGAASFTPLGERQFKNIAEPVACFRLQ